VAISHSKIEKLLYKEEYLIVFDIGITYLHTSDLVEN
jgi:hypothetical protein